MLGQLLGKTIGGIIGKDAGASVVQYFNKKQELKQNLKLAKLEGKVRVAEAKANFELKKLEGDQAWSQAMIANSGWKDEYVLVLLSIPLVFVFIPGAADYILAGFNVLGSTPEWYRWLIVVVFAAVYGVKPVLNIWKKNGNDR